MGKILFMFLSLTLLALLVSCASQPKVQSTHEDAMDNMGAMDAVHENVPETSSALDKLDYAAKEMKSWNVVTENFNDATKIKTVHKGDALSVYDVGDEDWYYSPSEDITIIKCNRYDAVNGWMKGNAAEFSQEKLAQQVMPWQENAKEMMGMIEHESMDSAMQDMEESDMQHMDGMADEN